MPWPPGQGIASTSCGVAADLLPARLPGNRVVANPERSPLRLRVVAGAWVVGEDERLLVGGLGLEPDAAAPRAVDGLPSGREHSRLP